jgi:uncharacterized membrane protein
MYFFSNFSVVTICKKNSKIMVTVVVIIRVLQPNSSCICLLLGSYKTVSHFFFLTASNKEHHYGYAVKNFIGEFHWIGFGAIYLKYTKLIS